LKLDGKTTSGTKNSLIERVADGALLESIPKCK